MNLAYKKNTWSIYKSFGNWEDPPPLCWEKIPNYPVIFFWVRPLAEFLEKGRVVVPDPKKLLQDFGIPIVPIVKVLPSDQRADGGRCWRGWSNVNYGAVEMMQYPSSARCDEYLPSYFLYIGIGAQSIVHFTAQTQVP